MADNNTQNQQPASTAALPTNHHRTKALWGFTFFLLLIGLSWLGYWFYVLRYEETTDDAYANGSFININSVIQGAVVGFYADDTDLVKQGQLLVRLDSTNYEMIYHKELATLASVTLEVRQHYDNVATARANLENKSNTLEKAKFDFDNRLKLREKNPEAVSNEDYVHSNHDSLSAQFEYNEAKSELEAALATIGGSPPEKHPLIEQQRESVRIAYYNLQHCSIYAPSTGYVAQRSVDVGQWVTPTVDLMAILPIDYVWVDANFKETQLGNMRIGQPAVVWFDLYGSKIKYQGQVIGIASGTGSIFSLIPPQNATGNWIKIVQRLPVRISLDPNILKDFPIRLGISASVDVDITNQDLPRLAVSPPAKPVAETNVFAIDLASVNAIMDKIVNDNLKKEPI